MTSHVKLIVKVFQFGVQIFYLKSENNSNSKDPLHRIEILPPSYFEFLSLTGKYGDLEKKLLYSQSDGKSVKF